MQIKVVRGKPEDIKVDIIPNLPEEISEMIFRMLDVKSVLASRLVSRKWLKRVNVDKQNSLKNLRKKCLEEDQMSLIKIFPEISGKLINIQIQKESKKKRKTVLAKVRKDSKKRYFAQNPIIRQNIRS